MPYNSGMSALTLVLPFALPPAELAPDLGKHLRAPALATLLSKSSIIRKNPKHEGLHVLPHERWLSKTLSGGDVVRWAPEIMRGFGLAVHAEGTWFVLNPGHIEIARSHLLLNDLRQLDLSDAHSRALFDAALPYVRELGLDLVYGDAATWFLRADAWQSMQTATPDAAAGLDISFFMPSGPGASAFRRLQNELQILWHAHPANAERETRKRPAVNAIWPWAGASAGALAASAHRLHARLYTSSTSPAWLARLAQASGGGTCSASALPAHDAILYLDDLTAPALANDWATWLAALHAIEDGIAAPLLAALQTGRATTVHTVLTGRDSLTESSTTRLSLRKFWRRASLDTLLT